MGAKNIKLQIGIPPNLKTAYELGFSGQKKLETKFIIKDCELGGFFPFVSIQIVEDQKKFEVAKKCFHFMIMDYMLACIDVIIYFLDYPSALSVH